MFLQLFVGKNTSFPTRLNNMEALIANNNMPEGFQAKFVADGDHFLELSTEFGRINMDKEMATQLKIDTNDAYTQAL